MSLFRICQLSLLFALLTITLNGAYASESVRGDHVTITVLAPESFGREPTDIGLLFELDPEWHIYWKNPGDSGAAPTFNITSDKAEIGDILWAPPERLPLGDLVNFGYEGEVVFPFKVSPTGTTVTIDFDLEWLVCKVDCIPGFAKLSLEREVLGESSEWVNIDHLDKITRFVSLSPKPGTDSPYTLSIEKLTEQNVTAKISGPNLSLENPPEIFPVDGGFILPYRPTYSEDNGDISSVFKRVSGSPPLDTTSFVLVDNNNYAWEFSDLSLPPVTAEEASILIPTNEDSDFSFALLILFAVAGGLLLNLMPCVFPVLSIKITRLLKYEDSASQARDGIAYTLGVLTSFLILGALFLAIRQAGTSVGWGFQLQSPVFVMLLILLFWLMALSFLGLFDFGNSIMNWAGQKNPSGSSFATGVLSVLVATPCTGPFMGVALGAAAVLPATQALALFLALGLGLALPFLILGFNPKALSFLPKPGKWMETFKQALAFPLFATTLWLMWVLGRQIGDRGWLLAGTLLLITAFSLWLGQTKHKPLKGIAWLIALFTVSSTLIAAHGTQSPEQLVTSSKSWQSFSPSLVHELREEGKPIFINFTAAWCITCQWNKRSVLDTAYVMDLFQKYEVQLVEADWTNYNTEITDALAEFGRNSVPLYVYYPPNKSTPKILPQILTASMIEELFSQP